MTSLRNEARKLGANSLLYLIPNLLVRGLTFLLTPVYTRHMTPAEYGVVALCNTISVLLGVVLGFALSSSITRLEFECTTDEEKREYYGTVLLFTLVVPGALAALLHVWGMAGGVAPIFRTVPYDPFLALALGTGLLNLFVAIPTGMFATREQPARVAALNIVVALCQTAATILFVVVWHQGARGALRAGLVSAACSALLSLIVMRRYAALRVSWPRLRQALAFSLPLVPHLLSNWVLSVSDRLVLERHVSQAALGHYSLGYLFSFVATMFGAAVTSALTPIITRQLKADPHAPQVPRLGTIAVAAITFACLGAAALAGDAIRWMTPPSYHAAAAVVPWVVLGALMQGVYTVWSQGTWFSMNTRAIPLVTGAGAGSNVLLNIVFVPRYGIMAAAVNTAVAYTLLALMHGALAHYLFPIRWEYRRWIAILVAAVGCYLLTTLVPAGSSPLLGALLRTLVVVALFPLLLVGTGVFSLSEIKRLRARAA